MHNYNTLSHLSSSCVCKFVLDLLVIEIDLFVVSSTPIYVYIVNIHVIDGVDILTFDIVLIYHARNSFLILLKLVVVFFLSMRLQRASL